MSLAEEVIEQLDVWTNHLALVLGPPKIIGDGSHIRLDFRHHGPHAVMVGKLVRAVSGLRGSLLLAKDGYISECAVLLRVVSDFCSEISAVAEALNRGGEPPRAVREFIEQYFTQKPRTAEEFAAAERIRYVSREELLKADVRLAEGTCVDGEQLRVTHQFLNMAYDSYVHGAYETTMELCDSRTGRFEMRGHPSSDKRLEFVEAVFLKMHEVVIAIELTAAVMGEEDIFSAARQARHAMDASEPWRHRAVET